MKHHLLLCILCLFFALLHASIVEDTCNSVTADIGVYNFCVTSFLASPESRTADKYELAVIGLELSLANHTYTAAQAMKLGQQSGLANMTKQAFDVCSEVYNLSLRSLKKAIDNAKQKLPFGMDVTSAKTDVDTCLEAFEEAGRKDLLAKENQNAFALDCIMGSINALLHPEARPMNSITWC